MHRVFLMDRLTQLLGGLAVVIVLFLIFREIVCWYWKINEALNTLKSIEEKLSVQINIMARSQQKPSAERPWVL